MDLPSAGRWLQKHIRDNDALIAMLVFGALSTIVVWTQKTQVEPWALFASLSPILTPLAALMLWNFWHRSRAVRAGLATLRQEATAAALEKQELQNALSLARQDRDRELSLAAALENERQLTSTLRGTIASLTAERDHAQTSVDDLQRKLIDIGKVEARRLAGSAQMLSSLDAVRSQVRGPCVRGRLAEDAILKAVRKAIGYASVALSSHTGSVVTICAKKLDSMGRSGEMFVSRLAVHPHQTGGARVPLDASAILEDIALGRRDHAFVRDSRTQPQLATHIMFPARTILVVPIVLADETHFGFLWASSEEADAFDFPIVHAYLRLIASLIAIPLASYYSRQELGRRSRVRQLQKGKA